jgi:hypothetical protein
LFFNSIRDAFERGIVSDADTTPRFFAFWSAPHMAGKKISRANMAHIHAAADHLHQVGANYPGRGGPDTSPIGKADMSFGDRAEALRTAVQMSTSNLDGYPYVEDIYDSYLIIELGDTCYRADYTIDDAGAVTLAARDSWIEVEEVWTPVQASAKAGLLNVGDLSTATPYASMKAIGDRLIEVKVAYYGHKAGKDSHGEYFSPNTDFDSENFPAPPLLYYHGFDANGKKMGKPAVTGKFASRRAGGDGHYLTYKLKNTKFADLQWDSAQKGACVVSPGTIGHLIRKQPDGELTYWPLAEISAWDYAANRAPANLHSVAAPVLKALYLSEGLNPPTLIDTAASETPEAPGEGASGQAHSGGDGISSDQAGSVIAAEIARALYNLQRKPTT